ncbi:MAG: hypothetical protein E7069_09580 [Bacteroidales bacterium]|nr:hypothetical protein [Bacteroidales bacterium]
MKNQSFKDYKFFVDQSGSYKYFRFEVFANQGANVMQLCQLRLIGTDAPDPAPATTVWTSLSVGDVIKVGDKIEVPAEGDGSWGINGNVLRNTWGPYELIRADIYQASESVDPVVTETEDGAFYVFKAENSDFYPLSNVAKAGGLVVTMTSDGLEVTAAENKEFTVAVHEGGAPAYETVMNLINEIPNPAVLTAECKAKIDAAREAYDALSTDDKELITNIATLTKAETDYTALNQAEADKVIAKIAAIPQPVELKLATRDSIESARAAYDALTAEQKALVSNYTDLTDAEAALAALNPGTAPSTPLDQAQAVKDLIEAIPAEITLDDNCVKAIDDARAAYDALRTEVQGALDDATVAKLTGAEDALALLKADHDAANAVIAKINAIGDVEYTTESKALIDAAREAYDALTEGQQALVTNSATLTTAESTYASLKAAADLTAAAYDLNTLIESAQEDYKSVAALPKYASIAEQLLDAINTAKGIAENSEATLSELQTAKTNLQTAYDKFNDDMSGTVTNVDKVNTDASESDIWFDLSGRRLQGKPTTPGLYINNGRKTIVK